MIIKNGEVLNEEFKVVKADIEVENDKISAIGDLKDSSDSIDATGLTLIPGLVDIHIHGCAGADTGDATFESSEKMSRYLASCGVTSFACATMSLPESTLVKVMGNAYEASKKVSGAKLVGINMEGPFFSPDKCGAQDPDTFRSPTKGEVDRLNKACHGMIKLVDVAPEVDNGYEFIKECKDEYTISIAHTSATYDQAIKAYDVGAKHATHLFNAMTGLKHREPGVVGAVFDSDKKPTAEMICDGLHLHPATIRTAYKILGDERVCLISDSMSAAGMPEGNYTLGGLPVVVKDGAARTPEGALAGSITNVMQCVRNVVKFGIPFESAVKCATINPAKVIKEDDKIGSLKVGKQADVVALDKDLNVKFVLINGKIYK